MSAFLPRKFLLAGQLYQRLKRLLLAGTGISLATDDAAETITLTYAGKTDDELARFFFGGE